MGCAMQELKTENPSKILLQSNSNNNINNSNNNVDNNNTTTPTRINHLIILKNASSSPNMTSQQHHHHQNQLKNSTASSGSTGSILLQKISQQSNQKNTSIMTNNINNSNNSHNQQQTSQSQINRHQQQQHHQNNNNINDQRHNLNSLQQQQQQLHSQHHRHHHHHHPQQQQHQQSPHRQPNMQRNSQQLKEQHSALVKLLESAPIIKNKQTSSSSTRDNINKMQQHQKQQNISLPNNKFNKNENLNILRKSHSSLDLKSNTNDNITNNNNSTTLTKFLTSSSTTPTTETTILINSSPIVISSDNANNFNVMNSTNLMATKTNNNNNNNNNNCYNRLSPNNLINNVKDNIRDKIVIIKTTNEQQQLQDHQQQQQQIQQEYQNTNNNNNNNNNNNFCFRKRLKSMSSLTSNNSYNYNNTNNNNNSKTPILIVQAQLSNSSNNLCESSKEFSNSTSSSSSSPSSNFIVQNSNSCKNIRNFNENDSIINNNDSNRNHIKLEDNNIKNENTELTDNISKQNKDIECQTEQSDKQEAPKYSCPWKKIRYAREWKRHKDLEQEEEEIKRQKQQQEQEKQKRQQEQEQNQLSETKMTINNNENESTKSNDSKNEIIIKSKNICDKMEDINEIEKTEKCCTKQLYDDIEMQQQPQPHISNNNNEKQMTTVNNNNCINYQKILQQEQHQHHHHHHLHHEQQHCRRDSSDSNSSLLSLSSQCSCSSNSLNGSSPPYHTQSASSILAIDKCYCNIKTVATTNNTNCCIDCSDSNYDINNCCNNNNNNNNNDDDNNCCCHHHHGIDLHSSNESMNYLCRKFDENLKSDNADNNSNNNSNNKSNCKENTNSTATIEIILDDKSTTTSCNKSSKCNNGFFRRSIQQKIQYRPCTKNQQCSILRINRNRCQYCRLKKCIAVGMSRDAVRFGRVPKREKARILAAMQQSTQNRGQQRQLATELDDQPRLLAAVLRAHMETCEFTKEKVAAMRQRARECPSYSMPTLLACPLNPAPELQSEQEFSERFAHVIRGVIDFAGMIPGFQLLNQDDKFTLLKAGLFDALFVRLICMFDSSINSIICLNGQVMRRDAIQNGANARFLVDSTFNFAERMNSMNLSDAEIGLFCAIVLITPDRPGLRNIELIDKMYSRLKGCLQTIINQNRPDQPDFMSELLKTLPDLRTLSTLHTEKLVVFRTEHKELLRQQMWQMEDDQPSKSPGSSGSNWDDRDRMIDELAKSPMGSVSSTESGDIGEYSPQHHHHHHHYHGHNHHHHGHQSSLASSAPLLAATLSGTCPLRHRANSGSSAEDIDVVVGSHAHLTQNGLTITPVARTHSTTASTHLLHHHLSNGGRYRKLDSPTDSGIESGNEKAESTKTVSSGGGSSCSSPRSSVDDALDAEAVAHVTNGHSTNSTAATTNNSAVQNNNNNNVGNGATKRQIVEDMPVLKRVLQAPPLYDTNSLMDEAYKPHKKFRALRHRDYDSSENDPHTTSTTGNTCNSNGSATSTTTPPIVQITPAGHSTSPSPNASQQSTTSSSSSPTTVPQNIPSPSPVSQQQSQLHMHLTRNLNTTTNNSTSNSNNLNSSNHNSSNNNYNHHNNSNLSTTTQSTSAAPALSPQIQTNQQQQHSSLSSTHSVLAKSLMAEPRMTPEQIKRSDIIQNYIMRGSSSSPNPNGLIVAPANNNSNPTSQSSHNHHHHHYQTSASPLLIGNAPTSPSTTTVTLSSPPPPSHQHQQQSSAQQQHTMRWQNQSVITTTTLRQQSVSPHSNSSSCSNGSTTNSSYFQSPHSTSVSPPRPSPSATHSPRLIELQVDIADSQQPLNLSKKSPTPPPPLSITTVSSIQQQQHVQKLPAALVAHKYPSVSPDVTVTAATPNCPQVTVSPAPSPAATTTIHKVLLEA